MGFWENKPSTEKVFKRLTSTQTCHTTSSSRHSTLPKHILPLPIQPNSRSKSTVCTQLKILTCTESAELLPPLSKASWYDRALKQHTVQTTTECLHNVFNTAAPSHPPPTPTPSLPPQHKAWFESVSDAQKQTNESFPPYSLPHKIGITTEGSYPKIHVLLSVWTRRQHEHQSGGLSLS